MTMAIGFDALQVHTVNSIEEEQNQASRSLPPPCPPEVSKAHDAIWLQPLRPLKWPKDCFGTDDWDRLVAWHGTLRHD